ncbi:hypothetical protein OSC27_06735 [Microbacterium sp. STN6]|uniref:hypothetical protein n=1 Tax=Microbacterium sp. STN6 TaxID=2995588 RepID=UPI002260CEFF|nr:hypothetical protein [Microbacterium sp. STN6]MCX7521974.1 hypothetical protein [Microbacterium sp. STN6]
MRFATDRRLPAAPARIAAVALLSITAFLLSGCASAPSPVKTHSSKPAATPVFATNDEALAAATKAYAEYQSIGQKIAQNGGEGATQIVSVVTPTKAKAELQEFKELRERGYRQVGESRYTKIQLQEDQITDVGGALSIYVCVDSSATDFVDAAGTSVLPSDRSPLATVVAQFKSASAEHPKQLVVSRIEPWSGKSIC